MLKERYKAMMAQVHAGHGLIDRVLQQRQTRRSAPLRAAIAMACCLVMLTAAFIMLTPPPKDLVSPNEQTPLDGNAASSMSPLPSDELTISVSEVKLEDPYTLSMVITARGDKIDSRSSINVNYPIIPDIYRSSVARIDSVEENSLFETSFLFILETQGRHILEVLDTTLELAIDQYTSGDYISTLKPELDWDTFPFNMENSDPIIHISDYSAVTAIGFDDQEGITVRTRWKELSVDQLYSLIYFTRTNPDTGESEQRYMRLGRQYDVGNIWYYDTHFDLKQTELDGWQMVIDTFYTGEVIKGNWPFTIDLSHLISK